jgi:hypothetical protein
MDAEELRLLTVYLNELYEDKFPRPNTAMLRLWYGRLKHLDLDIAKEGVERWAWHHTFKAPSLDELLEQIELVQDDKRKTIRDKSGTADYLQLLKNAAAEQGDNPLRGEDDATYGRLMVVLAERAMGRWMDKQHQWHDRLNMEQCGEQCYAWANTYQDERPQLADDLRSAARKYAEIMAGQPPATGEYSVPQMY